MTISPTLTDRTLNDPRGPIESFEWGRFTINGIKHEKGVNAGKNLRIIGSGVSKWEEYKTGLDHHISIEKIASLRGLEIEVLILGIGVNGMVRIDSNVLDFIKNDLGIKEVRIEKTTKACLYFNDLYEMGRKVAMFVHGTC